MDQKFCGTGFRFAACERLGRMFFLLSAIPGTPLGSVGLIWNLNQGGHDESNPFHIFATAKNWMICI